MKNILSKLLSLSIITLVVASSCVAFSMAAAPGQASAASTGSERVQKCKHFFFGLDPWYKYIGQELYDGSDPKQKCNVQCFNVFSRDASDPNDCGKTSSDVPLVLLAIVDDLLRIASLAALGFIFVGAFKYVGSQGNPESTGKAQETIINALIGLALAITAVAIVSFIGNRLGG